MGALVDLNKRMVSDTEFGEKEAMSAKAKKGRLDPNVLWFGSSVSDSLMGAALQTHQEQ